MVDRSSQISNVDSGKHIVALANNWQSCKVRVKTQPCSTEELVEDVIWFTITVGKTTANNMYTQVLVELSSSESQIFKVF